MPENPDYMKGEATFGNSFRDVDKRRKLESGRLNVSDVLTDAANGMDALVDKLRRLGKTFMPKK